MKEYIELESRGSGPSYIRRDRLQELKDVQAIIFDCDGVLIDVGSSYAEAVKETVTSISKAYMGIEIPPEVIDGELIHRFKATGGFNNDWALSYAIQMYIFSLLGEDELQDLRGTAESSMKISEVDQRFNQLYSTERQYNIDMEGLHAGLISFAECLDDSGPLSVDNQLLNKVGLELKRSLGYPGEGESGLIPTLFEYIFEGGELFAENFGFHPKFNIPVTGLVEKGEMIISGETLESLASSLGGFKFGIASGSLERTAKHVLGEFSDYFIEEAEIWMDDVNEEMKETGEDGLRKPDPFSLFEAVKALEPFKRALYVGDSMADLLMAERARYQKDRYSFAGVYQHVYPSDKTMEGFMERGSDIVAPSVNELPVVLNWIKGCKI